MQIFLQLPNGTTVPVQIPASIPSVPVIQAAQQQAKSNVISQTSLLQSAPQQSTASPQKSQTSLTKQARIFLAYQSNEIYSLICGTYKSCKTKGIMAIF